MPTKLISPESRLRSRLDALVIVSPTGAPKHGGLSCWLLVGTATACAVPPVANPNPASDQDRRCLRSRLLRRVALANNCCLNRSNGGRPRPAHGGAVVQLKEARPTMLGSRVAHPVRVLPVTRRRAIPRAALLRSRVFIYIAVPAQDGWSWWLLGRTLGYLWIIPGLIATIIAIITPTGSTRSNPGHQFNRKCGPPRSS